MDDFALIQASELNDRSVIHDAANILVSEWGGSLESRSATLLQKNYSWIYVRKATTDSAIKQVLGHVRLTPSVISNANDSVNAASSATLTSVVVHTSLRGQGIGRSMMHALHDTAKKLGYYYIYLWTDNALGFYLKLGYHECDQRMHQSVTSLVSAFDYLETTTISTLERLMARKADQVQHIDGSVSVSTATTSAAAPIHASCPLTPASETLSSNNHDNPPPPPPPLPTLPISMSRQPASISRTAAINTWMCLRIRDETPLDHSLGDD
mmetsp:Transcript_20275/g.33939  ORF Transcript_20275/g.33939 Transcript_20275/m.33939 type:complete len:268 (+) Transcript_20275:1937-2740(+)|eukprot:CAMPEP_0174988704 /NCGR_PEP_ID=MMETSP0004_2-20121128/20284_1 /TAXON_ID=420556 /ORGANISM="Ochromonas sp., Strain CCMP1393" /LENGTH=267 /DNA_ID=CAMNT_0016241971 /DNA_START=124 /DNA_END=927 /DNA_ORIENTATION=+